MIHCGPGAHSERIYRRHGVRSALLHIFLHCELAPVNDCCATWTITRVAGTTFSIAQKGLALLYSVINSSAESHSDSGKGANQS